MSRHGYKLRMPSKLKIFTLTAQSIISQVVIFSVALLILSVLDAILAFAFNYDKGKAESILDLSHFSFAFFIVVALPTSLAAIANKTRLFRIATVISLIIMEAYFFYRCKYFGDGIVLRHLLVLTLSLLLSCLISLPIAKRYATRHYS